FPSQFLRRKSHWKSNTAFWRRSSWRMTIITRLLKTLSPPSTPELTQRELRLEWSDLSSPVPVRRVIVYLHGCLAMSK
ncbi:unnamed protein product, partial [Musa hybrid cultivar]